MCRNRPGRRCSDHTAAKVKYYTNRLKAAEEAAESLETAHEGLSEGSRSEKKNRRLHEEAEARIERWKEEKAEAEFDYAATAEGRKQIDEALAKPDITEEEKSYLEIDKYYALARAKWQSETARKLQQAEKNGGFANAIMLAQAELANQEASIQSLMHQMMQAQQEYEDLDKFSKTPKGRHPSNAQKVVSRMRILHRRLYEMKRNQLFRAVMMGDMKSYIRRKNKQLSKTVFLAGMNVASKVIIR